MIYNIAIMGFGVVGSGVAELFYKTRDNIEKKAGCSIDIKYILDRKELTDSPYRDKLTFNFEDILSDESVKLVVEAMGGMVPAYDYTRRLLMAGKSVVTSNKELVAGKGAELLKIAREYNVNYLFEASVGGGIPIIHPLYQCLGANEISEIAGILNGTSNYILTRMVKDSMSMETALTKARELGYAEANPSADIDGHDACRKICILGSIAFGHHIYPEGIHTEGIRSITTKDVSMAAAAGYVIKLIGRAKRHGERLIVSVSPALISKQSPLANVDDVYNGIMIRGDDIGDVVFYGRGAGKLPTAAAVISDIIDAVKAGDTLTSLHWQDAKIGQVAPVEEGTIQLFLRVRGGGNRAVENIFGHVSFIQGDSNGDLTFITEAATEKELYNMVRLSGEMKIEVLSAIRILPY